MIIGSAFVGDNNQRLQDMQADIWTSPIAEIDGKKTSACAFIFETAKAAMVSEVGKNPLLFPEMDQIDELDGFDHRVLQGFYDLVAAFYRWRLKDIVEPAFKDVGHLYIKHNLNSWVSYLDLEVHAITWNKLDIAEHILRAVLFSNTEDGYTAEDYIIEQLAKRYGDDFYQAYIAEK